MKNNRVTEFVQCLFRVLKKLVSGGSSPCRPLFSAGCVTCQVRVVQSAVSAIFAK